MPRSRFTHLLSAVLGLTLVAYLPAFAEPVQEIGIRLAPEQDLRQFVREQQERNPDLEIVGLGEDEIRAISRQEITDDLRARGYAVTVVHPDLQAFSAARQDKSGNYGVWHTYAEMRAVLDSLHAAFPDIAGEPFSIGRSLEGREIWALKVSDHPERDEAEPEVLFDATHHAREIMTVELCLYLARYLCANYGTDPLATRLVDERQIYFVPIVNPDGFVYNETIAPYGGGMWRKNRRPGPSCSGVDLNRNYPIGWGGRGASGDPCAETYAGPGPASEPETQAMIRFMNGHRFVTHETMHSFQGSILYPWGFQDDETEDEELFATIGRERVSRNGYGLMRLGISGCTSDFAYGERATKPKILSYLTEIGGSGFWPAPSEKAALLEENLYSMLYLALVAGPSLEVDSLGASPSDGGPIEPGDLVELTGRVVNRGILAEAGAARLRLRCDDPYVRLLSAADSIRSLPPGEAWENTARPFRCRIDDACPGGRRVTLTVAVDAGEHTLSEFPATFQVGSIPSVYAWDFERDDGGWVADPSQTATAGAFVRIDPESTAFQPEEDATLPPGIYALVTGQNSSDGDGDVDGGIAASRSPDLDLSAYASVWLSLAYFFGQRTAGDDPGGDWFRLDVSSDGGAAWVPLIEIGDQRSLPEWRSLSVNLEDVIDLTDRVCLRVQASDGPARGDLIEAGLDDVVLSLPGTSSRPPDPPGIVSPAGDAEAAPRPLLTVANAVDPDGDALHYGFHIFADPDMTQLVREQDGVAEGPDGRTSWAPAIPLDRGTYYWRAFAADAIQRSLYSESSWFRVRTTASPTELAGIHADPNPLRGVCRVLYNLPHTLTSRVSVYDVQGREVRRLPAIPSASGWQMVEWDARDEQGTPVPSGSYWVRVWTPEETRTVRVVRIE